MLLCGLSDYPEINNFVRSIRQTRAGKALEVPLIVTEHYPEKLGKIVPQLDVSHACYVLDKTYFSMMTPKVRDVIKELFGDKPQDVVLYGLEVCEGIFLFYYTYIIHSSTIPRLVSHLCGADCYRSAGTGH